MTITMPCSAPSDLIVDIDGEKDASESIMSISLNMSAETMLFDLKIRMYLPEYFLSNLQEEVQSMFGVTIKTPPSYVAPMPISPFGKVLQEIKYRFDMKQVSIEAKENLYICGFWEVRDVIAHFDKGVISSFSIEGTLWLPKQSKGE